MFLGYVRYISEQVQNARIDVQIGPFIDPLIGSF